MWQIDPPYRCTLLVLCILVSSPSYGQIRPPVLIAPGFGGFEPGVEVRDFGRSMAAPGDLDGDGTPDLVVGSTLGFDGSGVLWFLFLSPDASVREARTFTLPGEADFGRKVAVIGDLDLDGYQDLIVADSDSHWILFLDSRGDVQREVQLDLGYDAGLAGLGDVDGDTVPDMAYGSYLDDVDGGGLEIVYLNRDGSRKSTSGLIWGLGRFGVPNNGFGAVTDPGDDIGAGISGIGDLDGDGVNDILVSAPGDDDATVNAGALYVMYLQHQSNFDDLVRSWRKIPAVEAGVPDDGVFAHRLGHTLSGLGDLDNDGLPEVAAFSRHDGTSALRRGIVRILTLASDGAVERVVNISAQEGNFLGTLADEDHFGWAVAPAGDLDEDGANELAISAPGSDLSGSDVGAVWVFDLNNLAPFVTELDISPIPALIGQDVQVSATLTSFGSSAASLLIRRGGDKRFFEAEMTQLPSGSFTFPVPAFALSERGLEIAVQTTNTTTGVSRRYPEVGSIFVSVQTADGLAFTVPGSSQYSLVSVPLILDDPSVGSVLGDDLGEYTASSWRAFRLTSTLNVEELHLDDELEPGVAIWLGVRNANVPLDTGRGLSVATDRPFGIGLWTGWNLIGNPFAFEIPVSNLSTDSERPVELWSYHGTWSQGDTVIVPLSGYAVYSEAYDTLRVDPNLSTTERESTNQTGRQDRSADSEARRAQLDALFAEITPSFRVGSQTAGTIKPFPNPFGNTTVISFESDTAEPLTLRIYDVVGRLVRTLLDEQTQPGDRQFEWDGRASDGSSLAPGLYLVVIRSNTKVWSGTASLVK